MKSLKRKANQGDISMCAPEHNEYPYGAQFHLDEDSISSLGLKDLPGVGTVMKVVALAKVVSTNKHEDEVKERRTLSLQITDMDLKATDTDHSKVLYKDKD